ncbi:MAG TPA: hypothetical protein VII33_00770 [Nakamurella sp.]
MAVHDREQFINDPPCQCGSTVTVRRRAVDTWQGQVVNVQAWCTEHPGEGHPIPEAVQRVVAAATSLGNWAE